MLMIAIYAVCSGLFLLRNHLVHVHRGMVIRTISEHLGRRLDAPHTQEDVAYMIKEAMDLWGAYGRVSHYEMVFKMWRGLYGFWRDTPIEPLLAVKRMQKRKPAKVGDLWPADLTICRKCGADMRVVQHTRNEVGDVICPRNEAL